MGLSVSKGAALSIGTTAADPAGDSFTEVGLISNIASFGKEYDVVTFKSLKTGAEERLLAGYAVGTITVTLGKDLTDTGQDKVRDALGINSYYNFKITANDTTATLTVPGYQAFKAKVSSLKTVYDAQNNVIGATVTLEVQASSFSDNEATSA